MVVENVDLYRQQVESSRQNIEQQKQSLTSAEQQLQEIRMSVPEVTQQMLRQTSSPLQTRESIRGAEQFRQEIAKQQAGITTARAELKPYEENVREAQAAIESYDTDIAEWNQARKYIANPKFPIQMLPAGAREKARQMQMDRTGAQNAWENKIQEIQDALPTGEKIIYDKEKMTISGIQSAAFQQSFPSIEKYNEAINKIQAPKISSQIFFTTPPAIKGTPVPQRYTIGGEAYAPRIPVSYFTWKEAPMAMATAPFQIGVEVLKGERFIVEKVGKFAGKSGAIIVVPKVPTPIKPLFFKTVKLTPSQTEKVVTVGAGLGLLYLTPTSIVSLGMIGEGVPTLLSKQTTPIQKVFGAAETGLGIWLGYKYATAPVVKVEPTRAIKEPRVIEIQKPIVIKTAKGETVTQASFYEIFGEKRPPIKITETTRIRELLGFEPIKETIKPAIEFIKVPSKVVIGNVPYKAIEATTGKKYGTISGIAGESIPTTLEKFSKLPKTEQYAWQQYLEKELGRPIQLKYVPRFLKDLSKSSGGVLEITKGRAWPGVETLKKVKIFEPVKVYRGATVSGIEAPFYQTQYYDVSRVKTTFKDVTYPFARATGKLPELKGIIIKIKEPYIADYTKTTVDIIGSGKSTTTLTKETLKQIQEQVPTLLPKGAIPKATIVKSVLKTSQQTIPKIVGTLAAGLISTPKVETKTLGGLLPETKTETKTIPEIKSVPLIKSTPIVTTRTLTELKTTPKAAVITIPELKTIQETKTISTSITSPVETTVPYPYYLKVPKASTIPKKIAILGKGKKYLKAYQLLVKRRGKYKPIGTPTLKGKAIQLGEQIARGTLARSFKVRPTKATVIGEEFQYLPTPKVFRGYKIVKGRQVPLQDEWIQKSMYSLSSKGETREIMSAKKQKGGKLKWL